MLAAPSCSTIFAIGGEKGGLVRIYYECELCEEPGGWCVVLPDGFGSVVRAASREKVGQKAVDSLKAGVLRRLLTGEPVPEPTYVTEPLRDGSRVLAVTAEVDMQGFRVTATEAADILGLSNARVTQLLEDGKLIGYREGRNSYVTLDSVKRRLVAAAR